MLTMATPGQASVCFSCGQPLPRDLPAAAEPAEVGGAFPLTGAMASPLEPPPNPYGASGASIIGVAGQFAIRAGVEVRVGRDPAQCPITLTEPRVRDEGSNNGTHVDGQRIPAGVYTSVASGGSLRFGPVEFTVKLE